MKIKLSAEDLAVALDMWVTASFHAHELSGVLVKESEIELEVIPASGPEEGRIHTTGLNVPADLGTVQRGGRPVGG